MGYEAIWLNDQCYIKGCLNDGVGIKLPSLLVSAVLLAKNQEWLLRQPPQIGYHSAGDRATYWLRDGDNP